MPTHAGTFHLDLYEYWLAKRGSRAMPARSDLDPAEIPLLLPHLLIVEQVASRLRYRLVGTAVVQEVGRDLTGDFVGFYVSEPERAARMRAIYERAFTRLRPVFAAGMFNLKSGATHNMSLLVLPLSDDGTHVNMVIASHAARFDPDLRASRGWLKGMPFKVDIVEIGSTEDLKKLCYEWERSRASLTKAPIT
jgi:hypothetical protein